MPSVICVMPLLQQMPFWVTTEVYQITGKIVTQNAFDAV